MTFQRPPPPTAPKKRMTRFDFGVFALVATVIIYAIYQVNDVLVYN